MTNEEFKRKAIRHGEVMITPIDELPANLERVSIGAKAIIGHSESGHHHVAVCDTAELELLRPNGADSPDLYLKVSAVSRVEHLKEFDRHDTTKLEPGIYYINTKTQYDYFAKREAKVMD